MSVNRNPNLKAYGFNNPLQQLSPAPVVSNRNPVASDRVEFGTTWVNTVDSKAFILVSNGVWLEIESSGGSGDFASLQVSGATELNTLEVAGATELDGLVVQASSNTAGNISLSTNGGTLETILISNNLGTAFDAIDINAVSGGVAIQGDLGVSISSGSTAGKISFVAQQTSQSGTFTAVNNALVGKAILTGNTIAQNADQTIVLSNTNIVNTSAIIATVASNNVSSNGAVLQLKGQVCGTGSVSFFVTCTGGLSGLGAADSIIISFIILS